MADVAGNIESAREAKEVAKKDLELAKKLYKDNDYYDWVIVILFYSACLLITSICFIEDDEVPRQHKGRWDKQAKIYRPGMLDKVKEYLSQKSFNSYSSLLVFSQSLRYDPRIILSFLNDPELEKKVKIMLSHFKTIMDDFKNRYDKYLK